jgi:hypothetical protein
LKDPSSPTCCARRARSAQRATSLSSPARRAEFPPTRPQHPLARGRGPVFHAATAVRTILSDQRLEATGAAGLSGVGEPTLDSTRQWPTLNSKRATRYGNLSSRSTLKSSHPQRSWPNTRAAPRSPTLAETRRCLASLRSHLLRIPSGSCRILSGRSARTLRKERHCSSSTATSHVQGSSSLTRIRSTQHSQRSLAN